MSIFSCFRPSSAAPATMQSQRPERPQNENKGFFSRMWGRIKSAANTLCVPATFYGLGSALTLTALIAAVVTSVVGVISITSIVISPPVLISLGVIGLGCLIVGGVLHAMQHYRAKSQPAQSDDAQTRQASHYTNAGFDAGEVPEDFYSAEDEAPAAEQNVDIDPEDCYFPELDPATAPEPTPAPEPKIVFNPNPREASAHAPVFYTTSNLNFG